MRNHITLVVLVAFVGCQYQVPKAPAKEKLSQEYTHEMKLEFGLNLIQGSVGEKRASFDFYHYAEVQPLEARFLIHNAAKELLKRIRIEKSELSITISFLDPYKNQRYKEGKIAIVTLYSGRIHYSVYNSVSETLEEVLQEEFISL